MLLPLRAQVQKAAARKESGEKRMLLRTGIAEIVAYIDPGTGGVVLQVLVAALAGVGFFFRRTLARVFSAFRRTPKDEPSSNPPNE